MEHNPTLEPRCDNCGAAISWKPVMHRGQRYCCGGCAQGGPCYCSYDPTPRGWLIPAALRPGGRPERAVLTARPRPYYEEMN